jgi:hypothetical protein
VRENAKDVAVGHGGNAGFGVVGLLGIFHLFPEDGIPGTRVFLQVFLIAIRNILGRDPFRSFHNGRRTFDVLMDKVASCT